MLTTLNDLVGTLNSALVVVRLERLEITPCWRHTVQQVFLATIAFGVEQVCVVFEPLLYKKMNSF